MVSQPCTPNRNPSLRDRLAEDFDFCEQHVSPSKKRRDSLVETGSEFENAVVEFFDEVAPEMAAKGAPVKVLQGYFLTKLARMFGKRDGAMERLATIKSLIGKKASVIIERNGFVKAKLAREEALNATLKERIATLQDAYEQSTATGTFGARVAEQLMLQHARQVSTLRAGMLEQRTKLARSIINRMRMGKARQLFSAWCSAHQRRKLARATEELACATQDHEEEWEILYGRMEKEAEETEARERAQQKRLRALARENEALKTRVAVKDKIHSGSEDEIEELFSRMEAEAEGHESRAAADKARIAQLAQQVQLLRTMLAAASAGAAAAARARRSEPGFQRERSTRPPMSLRRGLAAEAARHLAPAYDRAASIENRVLEETLRAEGDRVATQLQEQERQRFEDEANGARVESALHRRKAAQLAQRLQDNVEVNVIMENVQNHQLEDQLRAEGVRLAIQLQEQERQRFENEANAARMESALHRHKAVQLAQTLQAAQVQLHVEERQAAREESAAIRNTAIMKAKLGALRAKKEARASMKAASKSLYAASRRSSRAASREVSRHSSRRSSLRGSKRSSRTGSPKRRGRRTAAASAATPPAPKYSAPRAPPSRR